VREAIATGLDVQAMVRKTDERPEALVAKGAGVVVGDLFDIKSVRSALEGVEAAYFVYPVGSEPHRRGRKFCAGCEGSRVSQARPSHNTSFSPR